jgi:hypothetical protein
VVQLEATTSRFERSMQSLATKTEMSTMKTVTGAKFDDIKGDITNLRADFSKQSDGNIFFAFKLLSNEIDFQVKRFSCSFQKRFDRHKVQTGQCQFRSGQYQHQNRSHENGDYEYQTGYQRKIGQ